MELEQRGRDKSAKMKVNQQGMARKKESEIEWDKKARRQRNDRNICEERKITGVEEVKKKRKTKFDIYTKREKWHLVSIYSQTDHFPYLLANNQE